MRAGRSTIAQTYAWLRREANYRYRNDRPAGYAFIANGLAKIRWHRRHPWLSFFRSLVRR